MNAQPEKIRIITKVPLSSDGTEVWIGDRKIVNVDKVAFFHPVGEAPRIVIEVLPLGGLELEGEAEVQVKR